MKKCPYCGKEYPDEASVCEIDAEPLVASGAVAVRQQPTAEMTWLDKKFANESDPLFWGISVKFIIPLCIIGVFGCKHPAARRNALIILGWQMGFLGVALIIIVLLKSIGGR